MANQTVKLTQHEIRQVLQVLVWAQDQQYDLFNFGAEAFDLNSVFEKLADAACLLPKSGSRREAIGVLIEAARDAQNTWSAYSDKVNKIQAAINYMIIHDGW